MEKDKIEWNGVEWNGIGLNGKESLWYLVVLLSIDSFPAEGDLLLLNKCMVWFIASTIYTIIYINKWFNTF